MTKNVVWYNHQAKLKIVITPLIHVNVYLLISYYLLLTYFLIF